MQICVQFHFKSEFIGTIKKNKKKRDNDKHAFYVKRKKHYHSK